MALTEIARFSDVYEADLAASFLQSHGIEVHVTERFQTTVDPLMQRALGIRLLGRPDQAEPARELLARAAHGEFASDEGEVPEPRSGGVHVAGTIFALGALAVGGFWGASLPRRFRSPSWVGIASASAILVVIVAAGGVAVFVLQQLLFNPP